MSKLKCPLILLALLFTTLIASAKIWRVNNNIGTMADFTNFGMTVANAQVKDGDTIHIEPSSLSYGSASINKRLVVFGVGYLLDPATGGNAGL